MYPSGQHEVVPLQGGYPGQPAGSSAVQHTVVSISREPPKDYIVWSICSLMYANPCCLGLIALIYSVKARDRKMIGDLDGAKNYGNAACRLNVAAIAMIALSVLLIIIITAVTLQNAAAAVHHYSNKYGY